MYDINLHRLRKSLDRICRDLAKTYSINDGGCCYVAYLIAYYLDKLNIKYRFVIYSDNHKDIDNISKEILLKIKGSSDRNTVIGDGTCNHYTIYIEGIGIINNDDFKHGFKRYYIYSIKSSNIKWVYKLGFWNSQYNTNNNKIIRKIIRDFFNNLIK